MSSTWGFIFSSKNIVFAPKDYTADRTTNHINFNDAPLASIFAFSFLKLGEKSLPNEYIANT
jgi:hypothetical protein